MTATTDNHGATPADRVPDGPADKDQGYIGSGTPVEGEEAWVWEGLTDLDDALVAAVHVVLAQLYAVHTSARLGKTIDNPFPQGDVNRVVQGVVIHPFEAKRPVR